MCAPPFRHQPLTALCVFAALKSRRALPPLMGTTTRVSVRILEGKDYDVKGGNELTAARLLFVESGAATAITTLLSSVLPHAEILELEGIGHMGPVTNPLHENGRSSVSKGDADNPRPGSGCSLTCPYGKQEMHNCRT